MRFSHVILLQWLRGMCRWLQAKQAQPALASLELVVAESSEQRDHILVYCQPVEHPGPFWASVTWQHMLVSVPPGYPEACPVLLFPGSQEAAASSKVRRQLQM